MPGACAWACRDGRAAERLIDYTRTRAHAIAENPLIIEPPTLPSSPPVLVLPVCLFVFVFLNFILLPLSLHWNLFPLFPNIFGNSIRVLIVILFISKKSMRQYFLTIRWIFRDREIQGRIYIYNADKDIRYPVS